MALDRTSAGASVIDVLDHVLDKGVVIDEWMRVSVAGIDLMTITGRIVVSSIATHVSHTGAIRRLGRIWWPAVTQRQLEEQLRRFWEQFENHQFESQPQRRAEDQVREALHDARATTITKGRISMAGRGSRAAP